MAGGPYTRPEAVVLELAPIGESGNEVEPSKRGTFPSNRAARAHLHVDTSSIEATS
jgi:hypothetical protein